MNKRAIFLEQTFQDTGSTVYTVFKDKDGRVWRVMEREDGSVCVADNPALEYYDSRTGESPA